MRWSWKIAQVAGIGIHIHWTFLIVPAWIFLAYSAAGQGAGAMLSALGLILSVFACVLLHELGHALTAKRFGVKTRDITLLPIGGVARMERIPENPAQEFWIAVAGPAVNLVIAAAIFVGLAAVGSIQQLTQSELGEASIPGNSFWANLMGINIVLLVFNLLPAFPMDGGRVLRALLASRMSYVKATQIAATVGQGMAILFGILGLMVGHWALMFIALFVYIGAQGESYMVQVRDMFRGVPARDVMITRFVALSPTDTVQRAIDELLAGSQQDFPVVENGRILGMLTRQDLMKAITAGDRQAAIGQFLQHECPVVNETEMLDAAVPRFQSSGCSTIAVTRGGQLLGLLTSENLSEWMMIESAAQQSPPAASRSPAWNSSSVAAPSR